MTRIFGAVAAMYDDVRPGYPDAIVDAILAFHGGTPATVAELGAGTGKGTELLVRLGATVTCVEPDAGMAAVLRANFPGVRVVTSTFEEWRVQPGGIDVIACALAWHWLDPATRARRAREALSPGGTLAVFGHTYGFQDPAVGAAVDEVLRSIDPHVRARDEHWIRDDIRDSGVFARVEERTWHAFPEYAKGDYLRLVQTFSSFRAHSPEQQRTGLARLSDILGDVVTLDLATSLVLAGDG